MYEPQPSHMRATPTSDDNNDADTCCYGDIGIVYDADCVDDDADDNDDADCNARGIDTDTGNDDAIAFPTSSPPITVITY